MSGRDTTLSLRSARYDVTLVAYHTSSNLVAWLVRVVLHDGARMQYLQWPSIAADTKHTSGCSCCFCSSLMLTCAIQDPNAPKRGLSAYMFFANEQRENVREENPGVTFGQVGKILGERWKALSDKQRAPYEAKAAADKKRYEDEKQAYNVSLPPRKGYPNSTSNGN